MFQKGLISSLDLRLGNFSWSSDLLAKAPQSQRFLKPHDSQTVLRSVGPAESPNSQSLGNRFATRNPTYKACVPAGHLRQSRGPPGRKPQKSLQKVFPGLPARSLKKVPRRSKRQQNDTFRTLFGDFSTFSGLF